MPSQTRAGTRGLGPHSLPRAKAPRCARLTHPVRSRRAQSRPCAPADTAPAHETRSSVAESRRSLCALLPESSGTVPLLPAKIAAEAGDPSRPAKETRRRKRGDPAAALEALAQVAHRTDDAEPAILTPGEKRVVTEQRDEGRPPPQHIHSEDVEDAAKPRVGVLERGEGAHLEVDELRQEVLLGDTDREADGGDARVGEVQFVHNEVRRQHSVVIQQQHVLDVCRQGSDAVGKCVGLVARGHVEVLALPLLPRISARLVYDGLRVIRRERLVGIVDDDHVLRQEVAHDRRNRPADLVGRFVAWDDHTDARDEAWVILPFQCLLLRRHPAKDQDDGEAPHLDAEEGNHDEQVRCDFCCILAMPIVEKRSVEVSLPVRVEEYHSHPDEEIRQEEVMQQGPRPTAPERG
eukprot:scaffold5127_cov64-Phaeocystis_antarctica.AAC.12